MQNLSELNKKDYTHYTAENDKWPSGLKEAQDVAEVLGIDEKRVLELAESGYIPHWRIDEGRPKFQIPEVKRWAKRNILTRIEGQELPLTFKITAAPEPTQDPPASIHNLSNLRQLPNKEAPPGIYFLVKGNEVIYCGQSVTPLGRVQQHKKDKDFDRIYLLPVPESCLNEVEAAFIRHLMPAENRNVNGNLQTSGLDKSSDEEIINYYLEKKSKSVSER